MPRQRSPKWKLYGWDRHIGVGQRRASLPAPSRASAPNSPSAITGTVSFSKDGRRYLFRLRAAAPKRVAPTQPRRQAERRLWHWKDDSSAHAERCARTPTATAPIAAAYLIPAPRFVQLADANAEDGDPSETAAWALGLDDRVSPAGRLRHALLPTRIWSIASDRRAQADQRASGAVRWTWSPVRPVSADLRRQGLVQRLRPDGKINLTADLGVKFDNEVTDMPSTRHRHGGWTKGASVLLYDRYDVWRVAPDGSGAEPDGRHGRAHECGCASSARAEIRGSAASTTKPLLLGENVKTRDTGFPRVAGRRARRRNW